MPNKHDDSKLRKQRRISEDEREQLNASIEAIKADFETKNEPTNAELGALIINLFGRFEDTNIRFVEVKAEIDYLEKRADENRDTIKTHSTEINRMEAQVNKMEQDRINKDIIVGVFPGAPDLKKVMQILTQEYQFTMTEVDSYYSFKVPIFAKTTDKSTKPQVQGYGSYVVISFLTYHKKQAVMKIKQQKGNFVVEKFIATYGDEKVQMKEDDLKKEVKASNRLTKFNLFVQRTLHRYKVNNNWEKIQLHNGFFRAQKKDEKTWTYFRTSEEIKRTIPAFDMRSGK